MLEGEVTGPAAGGGLGKNLTHLRDSFRGSTTSSFGRAAHLPCASWSQASVPWLAQTGGSPQSPEESGRVRTWVPRPVLFSAPHPLVSPPTQGKHQPGPAVGDFGSLGFSSQPSHDPLAIPGPHLELLADGEISTESLSPHLARGSAGTRTHGLGSALPLAGCLAAFGT